MWIPLNSTGRTGAVRLRQSRAFSNRIRNMRPPRQRPFLVLLGSGKGSLIQFLCQQVRDGNLRAEIQALITDNPRSPIVRFAAAAGLKLYILEKGKDFDPELCRILQRCDPSLVLLLGFLQKIGPLTLKTFGRRIINTHPSLLPEFGGEGMFGLHVQRAVLSAKRKETGSTLHIAAAEYDKGPVIAQARLKTEDHDTPLSLQNRVKELEKRLLIKTLRWIFRSGWTKDFPLKRFVFPGVFLKRMSQAPFLFSYEKQKLPCGNTAELWLQSPLEISAFGEKTRTKPRPPDSLLRKMTARFLQGAALGVSVIFPGLSAGTTAFLLGIYRKLVDEISKIQFTWLKASWNRRHPVVQDLDGMFFIPLLSGACISLILFAWTAPALIQSYPKAFKMLVLGFVGGFSALSLMDLYWRKKLKDIYFFIASGLSMVLLFMVFRALPPPRSFFEIAAPLALAPAGLSAGAALVLPGLSGAYLLALFGVYEDLLKALRDFDGVVLSLFILSAAAGAAAAAHLMSRLLKKYFYEVCASITGLILGSLLFLLNGL